jgi:hypothetical protein
MGRYADRRVLLQEFLQVVFVALREWRVVLKCLLFAYLD